MVELSMLMRPEACVLTCPPLLLRHWVNRLKAMANNISHTAVLFVVSDIMLFSLSHQCFQLLMRDRAHSTYSTFPIRVALLYLFFESWNWWILMVISLSKYIQFVMNNWWITYNSNLANFMSSNFMTHKPNGMASHKYFKWQKIN